MQDDRPSRDIESMPGPLSESPWSADFVMQAIEVLPVLLRNGRLWALLPEHADSFVVAWPAGARPEEVAALRDDMGELFHWAGNMAIHIFDRSFLERLMEDDLSLPFHLSRKKVGYIDQSGSQIVPDELNAYKFERFIFDALPRARRAVVVEADRFDEFHPVKNAVGDDSPATAQAGMTAVFAGWLNQAGVKFSPDVAIEISPLFAIDADELKLKLKPGTIFDGQVFLS